MYLQTGTTFCKQQIILNLLKVINVFATKKQSNMSTITIWLMMILFKIITLNTQCPHEIRKQVATNLNTKTPKMSEV